MTVDKSAPILMLSLGFSDFLAREKVSIALTTYQAGRLFFIGRKNDGGVRAHERLIEQAQGLWTDGQTLWVSGKSMLWRFVNVLAEGELTPMGASRKFVPREARVTGRIDMHDITVYKTQPVFVNTLYSCLATISTQSSFREVWRPKFITASVPEDRCHMNGIASQDGKPLYVSAIGQSDVAEGWRERRRDGGIIIDVATSEIVASGLSMPHSPRLYQGKLWILNSGTGEFGTVDAQSGAFTPVCFCPGYARGLAFVGSYAVIGLSRPRRNQTFEGLELEGQLKAKDTVARSGLIIVDLASGQIVEWLRFEHTIDELYDVAVLEGVAQAEAIGFAGDDIERTIVPEALD